MRRSYTVVLLTLGLAACREAPTAVNPPTAARPEASVSASSAIPGQYIVRFRDDEGNVDSKANEVVNSQGGNLRFTYKSAIKGFAAQLSPAAVAALRARPDVLAVEEDQIAHAITTQANPPSWGLDRVDQRALPLDNSYTYNATGAGVTVFIIDTGINFTHTEFGGRAVKGEDEITIGGTAADCNGHGTHVSGTVGGSTFGIAKSVKLVAVRVLDCSGSGSYSQVIAGIDYATAQKNANKSVPMAANMSLGGSVSATLDAAVQRSIAAGITYAVAAGNSTANACTQSPADVPEALTVGATDNTDAIAYFSNFGSCVDIFAPGVDITSSWMGSTTATNTISGTSMASPHVAGAAALYLQGNPAATPAAVATALTTNATSGVVKSLPAGTVNKLLYTAFISSGPPPPPPVPVANFTFSCSALACNFDASSSTAQATATYSWTFGDATTGSGKTTSHTYAAAGSYSVTVTVTDAGGKSSKTQVVTVSSTPPKPVANFTFTCTALVCSFNGSSSTAQANATYSWNWGDATAAGSGKTPSHTYARAGTFNVTLTVADAGGSSAVTKAVTVTAGNDEGQH